MRVGNAARQRAAAWVAASSLVLLAAPAWVPSQVHAQQRTFKCGSSFQDRPCEDKEVQSRFSNTTGRFEISQVNPNTDRDCARLVSEAMPYWMRMHKDKDAYATILTEVEAKPVARAEKAAMRDLLNGMREVKGSPVQAQAQFEENCMNFKRRRGIPTEQQAVITGAGGGGASATSSDRGAVAAERAARAAERAARAEARGYR
jgi:hypothetical protein